MLKELSPVNQSIDTYLFLRTKSLFVLHTSSTYFVWDSFKSVRTTVVKHVHTERYVIKVLESYCKLDEFLFEISPVCIRQPNSRFRLSAIVTALFTTVPNTHGPTYR
jgi:hypothetical protein